MPYSNPSCSEGSRKMSRRNWGKKLSIKFCAIWVFDRKFCIKKFRKKFLLSHFFRWPRIRKKLKIWWIWSCSFERFVTIQIFLNESWSGLRSFLMMIFFIRNIFTTRVSSSVCGWFVGLIRIRLFSKGVWVGWRGFRILKVEVCSKKIKIWKKFKNKKNKKKLKFL